MGVQLWPFGARTHTDSVIFVKDLGDPSETHDYTPFRDALLGTDNVGAGLRSIGTEDTVIRAVKAWGRGKGLVPPCSMQAATCERSARIGNSNGLFH